MRSPHNATIFKYTGEVNNEAHYTPIPLFGVRFDTKKNVAMTTTGVKESNSAQLYIYMEDVRSFGVYLPIWDYVRLPEEKQTEYWTIDQEHDVFSYGEAQTPDDYLYNIIDIVHCYDSDGNLHHIEITGD